MKLKLPWVRRTHADWLDKELCRHRGLLELAAVEGAAYRRETIDNLTKLREQLYQKEKELQEAKDTLRDERSMAQAMARILSGKEVYDAFESVEKDKLMDAYSRQNRDWRRS